MRRIYIFCSLLLPVVLYGQEKSIPTIPDTARILRATGAVASVATTSLHPGMVHYPAQLLQGMAAGLSVARPGGDPNEGFRMRLRGIASITASAEPLIVIDGIPGASLETLDPLDIASFTVLKDAASTARYGLRGGSGVLLIETKQAVPGKLQTEWVGMASVEQAINRLPILSADTYRLLPGALDMGTTTDWIKEVTRTGWSQVQHLGLSSQGAHTSLRASMNFRQAAGVGLASGFQQLNARVRLRQQAFKERLTWDLNLASTLKEAELGTPDIFRYALIANPTMPVYDPSPGATYGGFAQRAIFDFYNPVAIAQQNLHDGKQRYTWYQMGLSYQLDAGLVVQAHIASHETEAQEARYASKSAKYGGGVERNGLASIAESSQQSRFGAMEVRWEKKKQDLWWQTSGGYDFQYTIDRQQSMQGGDFLTDAFTYHNMGAALDFAHGKGVLSSYQSTFQLAAFRGQTHLQWKKWSLNGILRYEGSSRLGAEKWTLFPGLQARVDLNAQVNIRGSWGIAGNQPGSSYLSLQRYDAQGLFYSDGAYVPSYGVLSNANPALRAEKTAEWDMGVDFRFFHHKLSGSLDLFRRRSSHLILPVQVASPPNLSTTSWMNAAAWQHQGAELSMQITAIDHQKFRWQLQGQAAWLSSQIKEFQPAAGIPFAFDLGGPGQGGVDLRSVTVGEPLGVLRGPVFQGVLADGSPVLEDLNGDGYYCSCADDWKVLGNGLPSLTTGLHQTLTWGSLDVQLLLRGIFGHQLLNSYRLFYENKETWSVSNYNVVATRYYNPDTRYAPASSLQVESAGFLQLSYLTLGYRVPLKKGTLRLQLSGQNLFTISSYTGIDPEVRYPGTEAGTRLYPGVERRSIYLPTKGGSIGIEATF